MSKSAETMTPAAQAAVAAPSAPQEPQEAQAAAQTQETHDGVTRVYLHTGYERLWHWGQAAAITLLLVTGLEIHAPDHFSLLGFELAIQVHNVLGFLLLANAVFGLFYELSTGAIRAYLPEPKDFLAIAVRQAMYYVRGIFTGEPHPVAKSHDKRLNPLQKITYLMILNVLLPLQMVTGLLLWGGQRWPGLLEVIGGLQPLALVHTIAAWSFAAFIVMHVYLTTTAGHTWMAGIISMITGWEEIHEDEAHSAQTEDTDG